MKEGRGSGYIRGGEKTRGISKRGKGGGEVELHQELATTTTNIFSERLRQRQKKEAEEKVLSLFFSTVFEQQRQSLFVTTQGTERKGVF